MKILLLIMLFLLTSCANQNELNNTPTPSFDNEIPLELITFDDDNLGVELLFKDDGLNNFIDIIKTNTLMDYTIEDDKSNPKPGYFFSECENDVVSIILDDGLNKIILTDGLCNKVDAQINNGSICSYLSSDIKISEYIYEKAKECLDIAMLFSDSNYSTYLMPLHFENDEIIINSSKEDYPHIPYILRPNERVKDFKDYNLKAYINNNEVDEIELIDNKKPHEIIFKDINNNEYLYVYQFE